MQLPRLALCLAVALASLASAMSFQQFICQPGTECYPSIFEATSEFQVVHEDQMVPSGLHIRMNLETGLKEAKLYDPNDDATPNAFAVVESGTSASEPQPSDTETVEKIQPGAQKILSAGKSSHEAICPDASTLVSNLNVVKSFDPGKLRSGTDDAPLLTALDALEEVAHDIHWGLKLCEDHEAVRVLVDMITTRSRKISSEASGAAALILGTAIQNNKAALAALLQSNARDGPLVEAFLNQMVWTPSEANVNARTVFLISELCQDPAQLQAFVKAGGWQDLRRAFGRDADGSFDAVQYAAFAKERQRVADFFFDHFLFEDVLANLDLIKKEVGLAGKVEQLYELCHDFHEVAKRARLEKCGVECREAEAHVRIAYEELQLVLPRMEGEKANSCLWHWSIIPA